MAQQCTLSTVDENSAQSVALVAQHNLQCKQQRSATADCSLCAERENLRSLLFLLRVGLFIVTAPMMQALITTSVLRVSL
jgi:hypothetical protein